MVNVTEEVANLLKKDGTHKELKIKFPNLSGLTIYNDEIVQGSFKLDEAIQSGSNIEFVGCISTCMSVNVVNLTDKVVRGTDVEVYLSVEGSEDIPLFHGIVNSSKKEANRKFKKITAYDRLYSLGDLDMSNWFNHRTPMPLEDLLVSFLNNIHVSVNHESLKLLTFGHTEVILGEKKVKNITALDILKNICQINAVFGIINRNNEFEVRFINTAAPQDNSYPSDNVFPADGSYPGMTYSDDKPGAMSYYEKLEYEDFKIGNIGKVIIRENNNSESYGVAGEGETEYIIQGNPFIYGKSKYQLDEMAKKILEKLKDINYTPYKVSNVGLPYMECGDTLVYPDITYNPNVSTDGNINFVIFKRSLTGDQLLKDSYEAEGEQYKKRYITESNINYDDERVSNLEKRVDNISGAVSSVRQDVDELKQSEIGDVSDLIHRMDMLELEMSLWKENLEEIKDMLKGTVRVMQVTRLPSYLEKDTIYFVTQGEPIYVQDE